MGELAVNQAIENEFYHHASLRVLTNSHHGYQNNFTKKPSSHLRLVIDNTSDSLLLNTKIAEARTYLQEDPHPGITDNPMSVVNSYAYCANNPWNLNDPTGMSFLGDLFTGILIGVASFFTGGLAGGLFASSFMSAAAGAVAGSLTGILAGGVSNVIQGKQFFGEDTFMNGLFGGLGGLFGGLNSNVNWRLSNLDTSNGLKLAGNNGSILGGQVQMSFDTAKVNWKNIAFGIGAIGVGKWMMASGGATGNAIGVVAGMITMGIGVVYAGSGVVSGFGK